MVTKKVQKAKIPETQSLPYRETNPENREDNVYEQTACAGNADANPKDRPSTAPAGVDIEKPQESLKNKIQKVATI